MLRFLLIVVALYAGVSAAVFAEWLPKPSFLEEVILIEAPKGQAASETAIAPPPSEVIPAAPAPVRAATPAAEPASSTVPETAATPAAAPTTKVAKGHRSPHRKKPQKHN